MLSCFTHCYASSYVGPVDRSRCRPPPYGNKWWLQTQMSWLSLLCALKKKKKKCEQVACDSGGAEEIGSGIFIFFFRLSYWLSVRQLRGTRAGECCADKWRVCRRPKLTVHYPYNAATPPLFFHSSNRQRSWSHQICPRCDRKSNSSRYIRRDPSSNPPSSDMITTSLRLELPADPNLFSTSCCQNAASLILKHVGFVAAWRWGGETRQKSIL